MVKVKCKYTVSSACSFKEGVHFLYLREINSKIMLRNILYCGVHSVKGCLQQVSCCYCFLSVLIHFIFILMCETTAGLLLFHTLI